MKTVIGVDIGYGFTKFTQNKSNGPSFDKFPSFARLCKGSSDRFDFFHNNSQLDTVFVNIQDSIFEVGHDIALSLDTHHIRQPSDQFSKSSQYHAMAGGALAYIGIKHIDLLVLGLPVSIMSNRNVDRITNSFEGTWQVTKDFEATVDSVWVLPQPLGSYFYYAFGPNTINNSQSLNDQNTCIIDVGHFTLDWWVTRGIKAMRERCGSSSGGMHRLISHISAQICEDFEIENLSESHLCDSLTKGRHLKLGSQIINLSKYIKSCEAIIADSLTPLRGKLGNAEDIEKIIVAGGGASLFAPIIKTIFKHHKIEILPDAQFSNVIGFQLAGEQRVKSLSDKNERETA
ncbi:MAG: plasmid segregation protein ParM [Gammaproteobacteria bacterium]|nr:plasmid segregation protein ParM [Gammaproteobacteria bacterium]MDH5729970.1 plasmid segregation protein ParM [Gammaproteobacteria bacterium]